MFSDRRSSKICKVCPGAVAGASCGYEASSTTPQQKKNAIREFWFPGSEEKSARKNFSVQRGGTKVSAARFVPIFINAFGDARWAIFFTMQSCFL
jgi:hypothetical protein